MAGLSLAWYIAHEPALAQKSVLIIDKQKRTGNDRTWGFWQNEPSDFDDILAAQWYNLLFVDAEGKKKELVLKDYSYKLLRSSDFYQKIYQKIEKNSQFEWLFDNIISIESYNNKANVQTENYGNLTGEIIFDSINLPDFYASESLTLLQHFKGYWLKFDQNTFDEKSATLMDFSVEQCDECRFVYELPIDRQTALIEYTIFSANTLEMSAYDTAIKSYIESKYPNTSYEILETEYGIIPMSDVKSKIFLNKNHLKIGSAGGQTHPATGYTFLRTQAFLKHTVKQLVDNKPLSAIKTDSKRHLLYAHTLLNVLFYKRYAAAEVFSDLFSKNPAWRVFRFLDGHSNITEEIKLMYSVSTRHFLPAFISSLKKYLSKR